jgi:EAL domain-containing protein (putative c-di-GMP-specific phosphodiesterase class I)
MTTSTVLAAILAPGALQVAFQPIVHVRGTARRLHGLECLVRGPRGTNLEPAGVLFSYVRRKREEIAVDRACVAAALEAARRLPAEVALSLNIHAATLERDPEFVMYLTDEAEARAIELSRLTVEVVEHAPLWSGPAFREALSALRDIGVAIALDDIGLGQSNYRMMIDCKPEYFKVDGYLVQGCRSDFYRMAVLESVASLARRFGARVVAEGVEEEDDLIAVSAVGVDLFQGHALHPPSTLEALKESGILAVSTRPPEVGGRADNTV